jgi:hypothetical protein
MSAAKPPAARPRAGTAGLPRWHSSFLHFRRWRLPAAPHREQMADSDGLFLVVLVVARHSMSPLVAAEESA